MRLRRSKDNEGARVETIEVNKTMNKKPKKSFSFSFGIGYSINGRNEDIFAVKISTN